MSLTVFGGMMVGIITRVLAFRKQFTGVSAWSGDAHPGRTNVRDIVMLSDLLAILSGPVALHL